MTEDITTGEVPNSTELEMMGCQKFLIQKLAGEWWCEFATTKFYSNALDIQKLLSDLGFTSRIIGINQSRHFGPIVEQ